jgi:zinc protease
LSFPNPLPAIEHEVVTLDNGLTVVIAPDRQVPVVAVDVNYRVGAKNERPGKTGLAHLLEHLMFQGSEHFDRDFFQALQGVGGQVNGATDPDRTRYWEMVPTPYLERALWLESDRMGHFLGALSPERFANQLDVVRNERRQNYENRPYGTLGEELARLLYPSGHPYSWPVIGWMADLDGMVIDDAREFFRRHYTPNNASLAIVGDVEPAAARALAERWFGGIEPGPALPRLRRHTPTVADPKRLVIEDRVALPLVVRAWPTVPAYDPDSAALDVFAEVFGAGKTGRLYQSLVYERQMAQNVYAVHATHELAGAIYVYALPRPGVELATLAAALDQELRSALARGIELDDLTRAQAARATAEVRALERRGGFGGRADSLNAYLHYLGHADGFREDLQRYLDLDPTRVVEAARRYLGAQGERPRVEVEVVPRPERRAGTAPSQQERATLPGPSGPLPGPRLPVPTRLELDNGLRILLVSMPGQPAAEANLLVPHGTASDPAELPGLADFTTTMLEEGSWQADGSLRPALALAAELKRLGTRLASRIGDDWTSLRLSTLRPNLDASLTLLGEVVSRPAFLAEEVDRQRQDRLTTLRELREDPEVNALRTVFRQLYADHPYGHSRLGDEAANQAVDSGRLHGFWRQHFRPETATLVLVGDLDPAAAKALAARSFATWEPRDTPAPLRTVPPPQPSVEPRLFVVDRPGSAQSVLAVTQVGLPRVGPDYYRSRLFNQCFGGFFSSRLNRNLRERLGFTYGARSWFTYGRVAGPFVAWAAVDTAVTVDALREMLDELSDAAGRRPFTAEEVEFARGNLVASYGMAFETSAQVAAILGDLPAFELPDDTPQRFAPAVSALDADAVNEFAQRFLGQQLRHVVVVGDLARLEPALAGLGLGPIVRCNADGRVLSA